MTTSDELFSLNLPKQLVGEIRYGGANSERPELTYEVELRNLGRAERLTARRSTPARSATHERLSWSSYGRQTSNCLPVVNGWSHNFSVPDFSCGHLADQFVGCGLRCLWSAVFF